MKNECIYEVIDCATGDVLSDLTSKHKKYWINEKDCLKAVAKEIGKDIWDDKGMNAVLKSITTAYVSDARWPPAPTSPGRFNVREALDALYAANEGLRKVMEDNGIAHKCGLHSYNIMQTQIAAIDDELMALKYFEE